MKNQVLVKAGRKAHSIMNSAKKNSPTILMVAGGITCVGGFVYAVVAGMKTEEKLQPTKEKIVTIHEDIENPEKPEYTEEVGKKDLAKAYGEGALEMIKLYGPAVLLEGTGIVCMLSANNILKRRNALLAAAYTSLSSTFTAYRERVAKKYGIEAERDIRFGVENGTVTEKGVDKKGKEVDVEKTVKVVNLDKFSEYAIEFSRHTSVDWKPQKEYRDMFIDNTQNYANDLLISKGRLFLNEVYEALGAKIQKPGQIVGWQYDKSNPSIDNKIVFEVYEDYHIKREDGTIEKVTIIDFNVDGPIIDTL